MYIVKSFGCFALFSYFCSLFTHCAMNIKHVIAIASLASALSVSVVCAGCSRGSSSGGGEPSPRHQTVAGDSTVYALAASGTNDSILVFLRLPYTGSDPDTVSILDAVRRRQVFGRPDVGDNVAIMRSSADSCVAVRVIVTEKLTGRWHYEVFPVLRHKVDSEGPLPEHLLQLLAEPREYAMVFKTAGTVYTTGRQRRQADEQLPVDYPAVKSYGRWQIYNGRLLLSEVRRDTAGTVTITGTDTADFVRLGRDTLVLMMPGGEEQGFYRKE